MDPCRGNRVAAEKQSKNDSHVLEDRKGDIDMHGQTVYLFFGMKRKKKTIVEILIAATDRTWQSIAMKNS